MKVKSESEVSPSCPTLSDPMDCSLAGSSVHGIFPGKSTGLRSSSCLVRKPPQAPQPEETRIERDSCNPIFIAALFIIARTWKQPRCPSADEWIKKLWYIYIVDYYSAIKQNEFESAVEKWMNLLLLSRFSCVRLCETPQTAAHQAPPSLGFSRQEHWSGLPFPSPMHESEKSK